MERPAHAGLRHLALNVRDMAAMKQFYVDKLGFRVEWEPDPDNVYLTSGIDNLALHKGSDTGTGAGDTGTRVGSIQTDSRPFDHSSPLDHLGLIVRSADDVDRWAAFLERQGVELKAKPKTHRDGARSLYFADPDGNTVQIIHHPPISDKT